MFEEIRQQVRETGRQGEGVDSRQGVLCSVCMCLGGGEVEPLPLGKLRDRSQGEGWAFLAAACMHATMGMMLRCVCGVCEQVDDEMRCLLSNLKAMVAAEAAAKSGEACCPF